jgi:uncharacterized protein YcfL
MSKIFMKKFFIFAIAAILCCACDKHNAYTLFDTPFVTISDESGMMIEMEVSSTVNNFLTPLLVKLNTSDQYYQQPISVDYVVHCGDGLQENKDFKIQKTNASPLVFEDKKYEKTINIVWLKNPDWDPNKDNTLVVELVSSSLSNMTLGYPGPSKRMKSFKFIKTN